MKLLKKLTINGEDVVLIRHNIQLLLSSPGTARFWVESETTIKGMVSFTLSYAGSKKHQQFFYGFVDTCTEVTKGQRLLFCRELTATLSNILPISLRHVKAAEVLTYISGVTGLAFNLPGKDYSKVIAPYFYSQSSGILAIERMAEVFKIKDFIWQQSGDGVVYIGSWQDSFWQSRPIEIPLSIFSEVSRNRWVLPASPSIRPGVMLNNHYVTGVCLSGVKMELECKLSLKK